jgi:hypothetical protein
MSPDHMTVTIDYLPSGCLASTRLVLTAEEYFEPETSGAAYDLNSVPRFPHALDYLSLAPAALEYTELSINDKDTGTARIITERYWNGGACAMIERHDLIRGIISYAEVILETPGHDFGTWQILRLVRSGDFFVPCSHVVISERPDGSQDERILLSNSVKMRGQV